MAEYIGWITSNQTFNDSFLSYPGDVNRIQELELSGYFTDPNNSGVLDNSNLNKYFLYTGETVTNYNQWNIFQVVNNENIIQFQDTGCNVQTWSKAQYVNSNFQYLKDLLISEQRKISYLDLYRIDKYLGKDEVSTIGSAFAQLLPCHAIGINAAAARYHDINLNKGDLLLKAANGEPIRIEAPGNGMYYPQIIFENNKYYIKWYYTAEDDDNENLTGYTYYKAQGDIPSTETKGFYYDGIELKNKANQYLII